MNAFINLIKLAWLQLVRHRVRSLLTIAGVASGMFLFTAVETLQRSLAKATEAGAADTTLVVYRQNRFCPSASRLPEHYADEIRAVAKRLCVHPAVIAGRLRREANDYRIHRTLVGYNQLRAIFGITGER